MEHYPQRKSPRLKGYDYAQSGAYFVTLCAHEKQCLFGRIVNEQMQYSALGEIAVACLLAMLDHFPHVELDFWVVMPNHLHAIVVLHEDGSARLTDVIGNYKAAVTRTWRRGSSTGGIYPARTTSMDSASANAYPAPDLQRIWHRSFHDHIIRNERALNQIRQYILANPARWSADGYFRA